MLRAWRGPGAEAVERSQKGKSQSVGSVGPLMVDAPDLT